MFAIHDCLSDQPVSEHESKDEADSICEEMGGKNKCYYVFTKESKCAIVKESVSERGFELSLF